MHGLVNRALQCFISDTYGPDLWAKVAQKARLGIDGFEPMLTYDDALTSDVIAAACETLLRPREELLEDVGTYLVSHPNTAALRRLLRFGGVSFPDFLNSLEELPERGRLALPELALPAIELSAQGEGGVTLTCSPLFEGVGYCIMGLLRAMADDYGALVVLEHLGRLGQNEVISVQLLDHSHAQGRDFKLAIGAV